MFLRHPAIFPVIVGFGLSLLRCAAQDGVVSLQFVSFPKSIDPKPVELLLGDGQTLKVAIPSNELSPSYKVKRLSDWAVGESSTDKDGKPAFKVFGKAPALGSSKQLILLIRKGQNHSDGIEVTPIDYDVAKFGGGRFLFLNAAKVDIAGVIGGEKFVVKPGEHMIIKPKADKADNGSGRGLANTALYFRKGEETKPFFSSVWAINDKLSALVFFYHDAQTGNLRFHTIRDFPR